MVSREFAIRGGVLVQDRRKPVLRVVAIFRAYAVGMGVLGALAQGIVREGPYLAARRGYGGQFAPCRVGVIRCQTVVVRHGRDAACGIVV